LLAAVEIIHASMMHLGALIICKALLEWYFARVLTVGIFPRSLLQIAERGNASGKRVKSIFYA